jgi:hypothetical protein
VQSVDRKGRSLLAQRLLPDSGVCTRPPTDGALEYPGAGRRVNEQEVADMPARHLRGLWLASSLALGSIAVPGAALAVPSKPDWSNSIALRTIGGVVNPAVLIGFNPQPEPPALGLGDFETLSVDFTVTTPLDVTLTLHIEDAQGNRLALTAVPAPASALLFAVALVLLGCARQRRHARPVRS